MRGIILAGGTGSRLRPEITIDTSALAADKAADFIVDWLVKRGLVESV